MLSTNHFLIIVGIVSILNPQHLAVEAGWRPISPSWASSVIRRSPLAASSSKQTHGRHLQHSASSQLTSLFGVGNVDLAISGQRKRCLASIITASIRGGDSSDADDEIAQSQDNDNNVQLENSEKLDKKSKQKDTEDDNDDERYSRQMYALGARAHKLVRSTTAILDGPLGGKKKLDSIESSIEAVRIEGADGFDGLNTDQDSISNAKSESTSGRSETPSGLLYEISKNLALSGVGRIILVQDDEESSGTDDANAGYFDGSLDDLGAAYHRAALAEIGVNGITNQDKRVLDGDDEEEGNSDITEDEFDSLNDGAILLSEYIQRLNPGVQVDIISRTKLLHLLCSHDVDDVDDDGSDDGQEEDNIISLGTNPVVVCVDRSITSQLEMNDACRDCSSSKPRVVPFISVETAGVHAKLFCDFGPKFIVVDEDGETTRATLLDGVKEIPENNDADESSDDLYTVNCLEGERHDVSKGDVIEFQGEHSDDIMSGKAVFPKCQVVSVKSPRCFMVREWDGESANHSESKKSADSSSMSSLLEGKARSFSRVKLPKQISFSSLRDILQPTEDAITMSNCCDDDTLFAPSDLDKSFDPLRRRAVMTSMAAVDAFVRKYGRLPSRSPKSRGGANSDGSKPKRTDVERFQSLVRKMTKDEDYSPANQEQWDLLITQFAQTCRAKFTPVQAFSGALGAQEVLKAANGLYNPVRQFLLYDCDEVLQQHSEEETEDNNNGVDENSSSTTASSGQSYILGDALSNKLARSRLFLVGAGAIGCELLKNLAAMGAGTGISNTKRGCLILTDMDTIEKSNLSRQLLFRDHDVGEFKSVAARAAMLRFSPECRVEAHTSRVGEEEDGPFDDDFWSSGCSLVLNALDNVEARLFVDSQCVAHGLGLIDAGTLGPKGNVQVVVPHESESYGSSSDPPEPDIPVCTLKNFPYEISHTIQWARDLFDGYFHRRPRQANDHVDEMAQSTDLTYFGQVLIEKLGDDAAVDMAEELGEDLGPFPFIVGNTDSSDPEYVLAVKKVSLNWAIQQAHRLFFVAMDELLQKHPIDSVDDDGARFWSGARRVPKPLRFIPLDSEDDEVSAQQLIINERIAQFVRSAARLRMESFLPVDGDDTLSYIGSEEALIALDEQAKILYKKKKPKEILHNLSGGGSSDSDDTLSLLLDKLNGAKTGASFLPRLNLADFEKDDESNGHVAFVTATSNLRAMAYGIPPADAMETRRVAGRIVPAMITTTGLVSALSCLELVKLLKGVPLSVHRNAFVSLALPFFAFTAPMPAEEVWGVNDKTHTIWDRITVKGSSKSPTQTMTLRKFLKKIQKKAGCGEGVEISSISYGPFLIYANFLHSHDEELLEASLLDTVRDAVISEDDDDDEMSLFDEDAEGDGEKKTSVERLLTAEQKTLLSKLEKKRFIDFSVAVEDEETGEEFELPPIRLIKE
eukprot:CAMPEP_0172319668 /NCGR_PEP_ID=MMETSP1058-20130122/38333_1 /TAXON_ID=83371 /ORGANISM="Detonula confervacea, Strain CCMP 353" /LENGTH=1432 /DNA_ID=CAMNT_0013034763 /DNA_START=69 /DNA_END=4364 /DNA_ORIENTATION=+